MLQVTMDKEILHWGGGQLGEANWATQPGGSPQQPPSHQQPIRHSSPFHILYHSKLGFIPLMWSKFLKVLDTTMSNARITPLKGHGIQIGATLEYLLHKISFDIIKVKGRWAGDSFLIYLHKFYDIPWHPILTQQISSGVYKSTYLYLFYTLDLCNTRVASLLSWVTRSKA